MKKVDKQTSLLIVDDEPATRFMIQQSLASFNYTILEAEDGIQAIDQFNESLPDLVLMDVQMPKQNGIDVCQQLRDKGYIDTPIIMMTGQDDSTIVESAFDAGATDFITKPINWTLLAQRIRYALRNEALRKSIQESQLELNRAQLIAKMGDWCLDVATGDWILSKNVRDIYRLNKDFGEQIGYQTFFDLLNKEQAKEIEHLISLSIKDCQPRHFELAWPHQVSEENLFIELQWQVISDENGQAKELRGISQDVTERKRSEATIEHQAYYDHLTNLPNRRLFKERMKCGISDAEKNNQLMAIFFIDCDRFKPINDSLGHQAGDALLMSIADRLQDCVRTSDTVSRISGDEFAVLLEDINHISGIDTIANKIVDTLAMPQKILGHKVFTTVSIGIVICPFDDYESEDLLSFADMAMNHAKKNGGNQYQYYAAEMNSQNSQRIKLEQELREALDKQQLHLYYQPQNIIDEKRLMVGTEALLRWIHPERGMISPLDFIPIAEESGIIVSIGEWVIHTACLQAAEWKKQGYGEIRMGINLSPKQFNQTNLISVVEQAIIHSEINPAQLDLEITESISMQNINATIDTLIGLKELGVRISLDDFGTGYSSLSYLQKMPIDTLKIDRAFIRYLNDSEKDQAFVIAIITMAHSLGMDVVAEGVENEEQFQFLRERKCEVAQGFMFSPPVPAEKLGTFLLPLKCKN